MSVTLKQVTASTESIIVRLTERQIEVLRDLVLAEVPRKWLRPMDIGGSDASHHSAVLTQLHRKGLVARSLSGGLTRYVWRYRITKEGRAVIGAVR